MEAVAVLWRLLLGTAEWWRLVSIVVLMTCSKLGHQEHDMSCMIVQVAQYVGDQPRWANLSSAGPT